MRVVKKIDLAQLNYFELYSIARAPAQLEVTWSVFDRFRAKVSSRHV
jgi:hypothetical protein